MFWLAVPFRFWAYHGAASSPAALRAPEPLYYISKHRIPSGQRGERLRLRGSRVAALASERQHVLAEVI